MLRFKIGILLAGLFVATGLALTATNGSSEAVGCDETVKARGRLDPGASTGFELRHCSDPTDNLMGWVKWSKSYNPDLDIVVAVTSPSGTHWVFNDPLCSKQTFLITGPLEEGTWSIDILNVGARTAKYEIQMGIG